MPPESRCRELLGSAAMGFSFEMSDPLPDALTFGRTVASGAPGPLTAGGPERDRETLP